MGTRGALWFRAKLAGASVVHTAVIEVFGSGILVSLAFHPSWAVVHGMVF